MAAHHLQLIAKTLAQHFSDLYQHKSKFTFNKALCQESKSLFLISGLSPEATCNWIISLNKCITFPSSQEAHSPHTQTRMLQTRI